MFKIVVIIFGLMICSMNVYSDNISIDNMSRTASFDEDYFVGLKAYEDGFTDVAKLAFEEYLSKNKSGEESDFSRYLLYQIYQSEGNLKQAKTILDKLDRSGNKKFNTQKIKNDNIAILLKTDCAEAKWHIISDINEGVMLYSKSDCPIDLELTEAVAKSDQDPRILLFFISKIKDDKEKMMIIYNNLSKSEKSVDILNYYAKYFYINKMKPEFYTLYKEYKSKELLELALEFAWDDNNYKQYVQYFNQDLKKGYKLKSVSYCRMIESGSKLGLNYSCDYIKLCLLKESKDLNKTVLSCLIRNEDKEQLNNYILSVNSKDMREICEYTGNFISKKLFSKYSIKKFHGCTQKKEIYLYLVKDRDYPAIFALAGKNLDDLDTAFISIAYLKTGKKKEYEKMFNKIKSNQLKNEITALLKK